MLENLDAQHSGTTSSDKPILRHTEVFSASSLAKPATGDGLPPESETKKSYRLRSIKEMLRHLHDVKIFSGGQMRYLLANGIKVDETDRIPFRKHFEEKGYFYFDPEESIAPALTHSSESTLGEFDRRRQVDRMGVLTSGLDIYTVGEENIGIITMFEILWDHYLDTFFHLDNRRVIDLTDAPSIAELQFKPATETAEGLEAHFQEAISCANFARKEFLIFVKQGDFLISKDEDTSWGVRRASTHSEFEELQKQGGFDAIYEITSERLHAEDLVQAFADATARKKILIYFDENFQKDGYPVLNNRERNQKEHESILMQYQREGTKMRHIMINRVQHDTHSKVVHSSKDAIEAIDIFYGELDANMKAKILREELADRSNTNPNYMAQ